MKKGVLPFDEVKRAEEAAVSSFIDFYSSDRDFSRIVYDEWTAKDVLAHVTSWHMSFARNLLDAVQGKKPSPFAGSLSTINEREVQRLSVYSVYELIGLLQEAQTLIGQNIGNPGVELIAYKKGSRDYSPLEHLDIVTGHITKHLNDVRKKFRDA